MEISDKASSSIDTVETDHCPLFQFIVDTVITGLICLFGFAGNTVTFMTLWQERVCVTTFLLQGVIIVDFAVVWMLFVGDVIPGLGWMVDMLRDCEVSCGYVHAVTQPLLFLAQICGMWLLLLALIDRYVLMCKPNEASHYCTLDTARKHVIIVIMVAVIMTLPLTFDKGLKVNQDNVTEAKPLEENYWYRLIYLDVLTLFLVYVIPMLGQLIYLSKLARVARSVHRLRRSLAASYRTQHMDITQLLMTLTITTVICYVPMVTTRGILWGQGHPEQHCATLLYYLDSFSKLFMALNSSIKILLYCMFQKGFNKKARESLSCRGCCRKHKAIPTSDSSYGMYKCADMSEMTLISNVDSRL